MFFFKDMDRLKIAIKDLEKQILIKKESLEKLSNKEKDTTEIKALEEEIARKKALLLRRKTML